MSLDSPACRRAFGFYADLARLFSPGGKQAVDTTRDTYFAGRAAMILWSPSCSTRWQALGEGVRSFRRWGFEAGRGALVGALRHDEPVAHALADSIRTAARPRRPPPRRSARSRSSVGKVVERRTRPGAGGSPFAYPT